MLNRQFIDIKINTMIVRTLVGVYRDVNVSVNVTVNVKISHYVKVLLVIMIIGNIIIVCISCGCFFSDQF